MIVGEQQAHKAAAVQRCSPASYQEKDQGSRKNMVDTLINLINLIADYSLKILSWGNHEVGSDDINSAFPCLQKREEVIS